MCRTNYWGQLKFTAVGKVYTLGYNNEIIGINDNIMVKEYIIKEATKTIVRKIWNSSQIYIYIYIIIILTTIQIR